MKTPPHFGSFPRALLHIDCDAFFASCEQAQNPAYRGRPVVTGKERGIVAAASYEAKAFGVKRGVPLWEVKKLCPNAIILPSDYETYSLFSKRMFAIIRRFTPDVEEYSIDEAFADITGFRRPYHTSYENIALRIKNAIESDLGITVSVGLSVSKVLCKIGSKWKKPAGFTPIPAYKINEFLARTPVENVWGIGPATAAYCKKNGMRTALDFAQKSEAYIQKNFTKPHYEIWQELNGNSVYEITTEEHTDYATISKTKTFTPPSSDPAFVFAQLCKNLENACIKARRHNLVARGFTAFLKTQEYRYSGMEAALSRPSAFPQDMMETMRKIFAQIFKNQLYRATGIVLQNLQPNANLQLSLFDPPVRLEKLTRLYQTVDNIAAKLGKHKIHLGASFLANHDPAHAPSANRPNPRGDIPLRKLNRVTGETSRKHLPLPMLLNPG